MSGGIKISQSQIEKMLEEYIRINYGVDGLAKLSNGKNKDSNASVTASNADISAATLLMLDLMRKVLKNYSIEYEFADSIKKNISTLSSSPIKQNSDGTKSVYINFGGDLYRKSLYSSEGIDNIIALINNGYSKAPGEMNYVYGIWEGHKDFNDPSREAYIRSNNGSDGSWGRRLGFMEEIVDEFNKKYRDKYNVTAIMGSDYK